MIPRIQFGILVYIRAVDLVQIAKIIVAVNNKKTQSKPFIFGALGIGNDNSKELCHRCVSEVVKIWRVDKKARYQRQDQSAYQCYFLVVIMHYQCSCTTLFAALCCLGLLKTWSLRLDNIRRAGCRQY